MVTRMGGKQKQPQSDYGMVDERKLAGKTPRRVKMPPVPTQEQILDKLASAFKVKLEGMGTVTTAEYAEALENMTARAEKILEHMAETYPVEKYPKSDIQALSKKNLMQALAERAEILSIAESLEGKGLRKICEEFVSRVKDAKNVSKAEYESFLNRFVAGEESVGAILKDLTLDKGEKAGINALLKQGDNLSILEMGRNFNAVRGFNYPTAGIKAWAWKQADRLAKANLTDFFGKATWAWDLYLHGKKAMPLGEHLAKQYEAKHAKFTRKISLLNIGKVAIAAGVVLAAGYLFRCVGGFFLGSDEKEGKRPSVQKKRRKPVSPAEIELYKNHLFRRKDETKTAKFVVIAKHMADLGLSDGEQVKVAKILNKLSETSRVFIMGAKLRESVKLAIMLRALSPKVSTQKIAETVIAIQDYVDPQQTKQFAQQLAKKATSTADIDAFFQRPPKNIKMADAWYNRVFPAFTKAGFSKRDNLLPPLCGTIRRARVKKRGKEGGTYALTMVEQNNLAESLAGIYGKKVPQTYHEDIEFILGMRAKGFKVTTAATIMSRLRFVYKLKHDKAADAVLRNLKPGMKENDLRLAIEAPAFRNRGMASDTWEKSTDPRLSLVLTGGKDANKFSANLREFPQGIYEESVEILTNFTRIWQDQKRVLTNKNITPLLPQLELLARSRTFAHLTPAKKAQILFQLVSKIKATNKKPNPRTVALNHLEKTFRGKKPTVAATLKELDAHLEPEEAAGAE